VYRDSEKGLRLRPSEKVLQDKKESKQLMDKLKVFARKNTDNFRVWYKSVKRYFHYERKKFTVNVDKFDWLRGRLEGKALFWQQSCQEHFEMSHRRDTWVQYEEALCKRYLSVEEDKLEYQHSSTRAIS
jgi:hypothetical protein